MCRASVAPDGATVDAPWCVLKLEGPFDLTGETGVIASVALPLADAQISVFAMATYDTDYVLVPGPRAGQARAALTRAGHAVAVAPTTLRPATLKDVPAVACLVAEALMGYRATFAPPEWDSPDMTSESAIAERYGRSGSHQTVAVDAAGNVVGVAATRASEEADLGHVWQVFVDPAHAGTGLGDGASRGSARRRAAGRMDAPAAVLRRRRRGRDGVLHAPRMGARPRRRHRGSRGTARHPHAVGAVSDGPGGGPAVSPQPASASRAARTPLRSAPSM